MLPGFAKACWPRVFPKDEVELARSYRREARRSADRETSGLETKLSVRRNLSMSIRKI
jgi:hypothetical protein